MEKLGWALHTCQAFEHSLCLLMSLLSEHRSPSRGQAFLASWDFHSRKTLGYLVRALRDEIEIPNDFEEYLKEGVDCRNRIVHHFITDAGMRLLDPKGRLEVIHDLHELKENVKSRDRSLEPIIDKLLEKYGLSTEILKTRADKNWKWSNYQTSDRKPPGNQ